MDLLGSILDSMDKPPTISPKEKALLKKRQQDLKNKQKAEANNLKHFRDQVEEQVNDFVKKDHLKQCSFPPMNQLHRSIIYDVCEVANILAFSFGEEGVDRHIIVFKKEHAPSEDQLNALRNGEEWNEESEKRLREKKLFIQQTIEENMDNTNIKFIPNSNYQDKYEHLIGKKSALEAARKTEANSNYGYVPSENKRDQRSIEQTLADIKNKRRKLQS